MKIKPLGKTTRFGKAKMRVSLPDDHAFDSSTRVKVSLVKTLVEKEYSWASRIPAMVVSSVAIAAFVIVTLSVPIDPDTVVEIKWNSEGVVYRGVPAGFLLLISFMAVRNLNPDVDIDSTSDSDSGGSVPESDA